MAGENTMYPNLPQLDNVDSAALINNPQHFRLLQISEIKSSLS
jgi:hypothetical protein